MPNKCLVGARLGGGGGGGGLAGFELMEPLNILIVASNCLGLFTELQLALTL